MRKALLSSTTVASAARMVRTGRCHELCTKDSWVFPIGVGPVPSYWAHPILPGQQAIAARVAGALDR